VLWPEHCVVGTPGAAFAQGLESGALDAVVRKGMHPAVECYSAFYDVWGGNETELRGLLAVRRWFLVGWAFEFRAGVCASLRRGEILSLFAISREL
jgi:nicotinamidase/pyrazinamidase